MTTERVNTDAVIQRLRDITHTDSDAALSRALGKNKGTIGQWRIRGVSWPEIVALAEKHNYSLDYIAFGNGGGAGGDGLVCIDVMSSDGNSVDVIGVTDDFLGYVGVSRENIRGYRVNGEEMEPSLRAGDYVLIDVTINAVLRSGLYAIAVDNTIWIRRVVKQIDGVLSVVCDNSTYPSVQTDSQKLKIVGRVISHTRFFI